MGKYVAFVITLYLFIMIAKSTDGDTIDLGGGSSTTNYSYDNSAGQYSSKAGNYSSVPGAATTVAEADEASYGSYIGAVYSVTKTEYILLCNLLEREAGNGQIDQVDAVKVIETVFNRIKSDEFPDTVTEVIRQPKQFPGALSSYSYSEEVNFYVKDTVLSYLNGGYPSHGYLYYWGDSHANYFYLEHDEFWHDFCTYYNK